MKPSNTVRTLFVSLVLCFTSVSADETGKHLFVLSGQSNMQGHRPAEAFTPAVAKALGKADHQLRRYADLSRWSDAIER